MICEAISEGAIYPSYSIVYDFVILYFKSATF